MDWLTDNKIPVGKAAKAVFTWMNDNLGPLFDAWASTPALGVVKAVFITLLVGVVVSFFTARRVFWRT